MRKFVLEKTTLQSYIDFNGEKVFESATVDTSITSFLKLAPKEEHQVSYLSCTDSSKLQDSNLDFIPQSSLSSEGLVFSSSSVMALKAKIESVGTPLKEWDISIFRGVLTGLNEVFIIDTPTRDEILSKCKTQEEREATEKIIKKMLRGRDIKCYFYEWAELWMIGTFPSLKLNIDDYPSLKSYLSQFRPRIDQSGEKGCRKKTNNQWFETQDATAYYKNFEKEILTWKTVGQYLAFAITKENTFLTNSTYFISADIKILKFLNACLLSKVIKHYLLLTCNTTGVGDLMLTAQSVEKLPIPQITESNKPTADKIIALVEEILKAKEQDPSSPTQETEQEIDSLVYTLYNLTDKEIAIIEGRE